MSFAEDPKGSFWYLDINDWGDSFAMGKCVSSEAGQYTLPFVYRKKERRVPIQCDSDELKGKCGQFTLDLASSAPGRRRQALATSRTAEEPNCFGFTRPPPKTTPAPPPTTPSPPSPTTPAPTTCDFCGEAELSCCGTGIHAFCYDSNYNECCPSAFYTEEFPVKAVCGLGQGCQPGCSPHVFADDVLEENTPLVTSLESSSDSTGSHQADLAVENDSVEDKLICPGKDHSGVFAVCPNGLSCCGSGRLTPECYPEEYTECCQPPDSDYSVVCAKGQGCAVTEGDSPETRVPYCIDSFEACRACADQYNTAGGTFNTYLCHVHETQMCFHSPDPESCQEAYGPSATFCYGVYADHAPDVVTNESSLTLI